MVRMIARCRGVGYRRHLDRKRGRPRQPVGARNVEISRKAHRAVGITERQRDEIRPRLGDAPVTAPDAGAAAVQRVAGRLVGIDLEALAIDGEAPLPDPVGVAPDRRTIEQRVREIVLDALETERQWAVVALEPELLHRRAPADYRGAQGTAGKRHPLNGLAVRVLAEALDIPRRHGLVSQTQPADAGILGVEVVVDALMAALPTDAAFLDAAERRLGRGDQALVDADHAILQPFHDAEGATEIAGIEVAGEAELGVVCHRDRIFFLFEAENRRNGAENLLLHEPHLRLRVRNHRRFEEGAAELMALPPGDDLAALGRRVADEFLDLLDRLHVDQRTLLDAVLKAWSHLEGARGSGELLHEPVVDAGLHEE